MELRVPAFNDTLYRIYEASLTPGDWPAALHDIAALFGSKGALLYVRQPARWTVAAHSAALDNAVATYDAEDWSKRNPWLAPRATFGFRSGDVYSDRDILTDDQIAADPFYADFLPRFGLYWQMVAIIESDLGSPAGLLVQRGRDAGPYERAEADRLLLVARHFEQSLRISGRLAQTGAAHRTVAGAFDALDRPAFILDGARRPLLVNGSARGLIGDYFAAGDGALRPALSDEDAAFSAALDRAHSEAGEAGGAPRPITVTAAGTGKRLVLWVLPLLGAAAAHLGIVKPDRHVLVVAQHLEQERVVEPSVVRDVFGLTFGEARLSALLAAGHAVREAAAALGITEGTARVVLKRAFQKLGVNRQSELVARISALARR